MFIINRIKFIFDNRKDVTSRRNDFLGSNSGLNFVAIFNLSISIASLIIKVKFINKMAGIECRL